MARLLLGHYGLNVPQRDGIHYEATWIPAHKRSDGLSAGQMKVVMSEQWPPELVDFEHFLASQGFICVRSVDPQVFGNRIVKCTGPPLLVRTVLDRGSWLLDVSDPMLPDRWYDAEIVRAWLFGLHLAPMSLAEQTELIQSNWRAIVNGFSNAERATTYARLGQLERERVRILLPHLADRT